MRMYTTCIFLFWKLESYFIRSFGCPSNYDPFIKSGKIATNADDHPSAINIK